MSVTAYAATKGEEIYVDTISSSIRGAKVNYLVTHRRTMVYTFNTDKEIHEMFTESKLPFVDISIVIVEKAKIR